MSTVRHLRKVGEMEWYRLIDAVQMSATQKAVAWRMGRFADTKSGARVHPGDELLMAVTTASPRLIRGVRAFLVEHGLLAVVTPHKSSGRGGGVGRATEYQLTFPSDFWETVPLSEYGERKKEELVRKQQAIEVDKCVGDSGADTGSRPANDPHIISNDPHISQNDRVKSTPHLSSTSPSISPFISCVINHRAADGQMNEDGEGEELDSVGGVSAEELDLFERLKANLPPITKRHSAQ